MGGGRHVVCISVDRVRARCSFFAVAIWAFVSSMNCGVPDCTIPVARRSTGDAVVGVDDLLGDRRLYWTVTSMEVVLVDDLLLVISEWATPVPD